MVASKIQKHREQRKFDVRAHFRNWLKTGTTGTSILFRELAHSLQQSASHREIHGSAIVRTGQIQVPQLAALIKIAHA